MALLLQEVDWFSIGEIVSNFETFTDVTRINIKQSVTPKSNYAEIHLKNSVKEILSDGTLINHYVNNTTKELKFLEGDTLKIYAAKLTQNRELDKSADSQDLLMSLTLEEIKVKGDGKQSQITLKCVDKTYALLNKLWSFAYIDGTNGGSNWTSPQIVKDVIRQTTPADGVLCFDSDGNTIYGSGFKIDARLESEGGFIEDARISDPTTFPDVNIGKSFKPAYEFIADVSTPDVMNTAVELEASPIQKRSMVYYIDEGNRFHWFYPRDGVETTLSGAINNSVTSITLADASALKAPGTVQIDAELVNYTGISTNTLTGCTRGSAQTIAESHSNGAIVSSTITVIEGDSTKGVEVISTSLTKKTFDIVNMVIYNAGQDLYGSGTLWYFYNINSKDKDLKMKYVPYLDICKGLIQQEIYEENIVEDANGPFTFQETRYSEATGDYDSGNGIYTSWGVLVKSDSEYNTAVRNKAAFGTRSMGSTRAEALTNRTSNPRWKGNISVSGYKFTAGDPILFTSNRFGIQSQQLRVNEVTHNITKNAWTTDLAVEEDEDLL